MPTTSMPRMPAYITGVLILQHNAATIELQLTCLHYGGAYITMPWTTIELNYNNAMNDKSMPA